MLGNVIGSPNAKEVREVKAEKSVITGFVFKSDIHMNNHLTWTRTIRYIDREKINNDLIILTIIIIIPNSVSCFASVILNTLTLYFLFVSNCSKHRYTHKHTMKQGLLGNTAFNQ